MFNSDFRAIRQKQTTCKHQYKQVSSVSTSVVVNSHEFHFFCLNYMPRKSMFNVGKSHEIRIVMEIWNSSVFAHEITWKTPSKSLQRAFRRYTFELNSDTGGRVFLNGTEISPSTANSSMATTVRCGWPMTQHIQKGWKTLRSFVTVSFTAWYINSSDPLLR